jgi:Ca2+-binding RTX toxin-like protein
LEGRVPKVISIIASGGDGLVLQGQSLDDTLQAGTGIQTLYGNAGNDLLIAGTGSQFLYGGSGDDTLIAGSGNQTLDGGSGIDSLDFSRAAGKLVIDQDLHIAQIVDSVSGAVIFTDTVTSFNKIVGTNAGNDFHAQANTANVFIGGSGDDIYRSENGGDTVTGGAGADTFGWMRKYAEVGHIDRVTDFTAGTDRVDLSDFLKGQSIKNPTLSDVIHLQAATAANGGVATLLQGLVNGVWHDVAILDGVNVTHVTVDELARL